MAAIDDIIQGSQGANFGGGIGNDTLHPAGGGGLFGMTPEQQMIAFTALAHLGQTIQAAGSRGRMAPPAFPVGAMAQLAHLQQRRELQEQHQQQLLGLASSVENDPSVPEGVRRTAAAGIRMGEMGALDVITKAQLARDEEERQRGRMVTRELAPGTGVYVNEDTLTGRAVPLGTASQREPRLITDASGRRVVDAPGVDVGQNWYPHPTIPGALVNDKGDIRNAPVDPTQRQQVHVAANKEAKTRTLAAGLADDLQKINMPAVSQSLTTVGAMLAKYGAEGEDGSFRLGKGGIPGLGPLSDPLVARLAQTEEGRLNRNAADRLLAQIIRGEAGLAQTVSEADRQAYAAMLKTGYTAQDFANAFPRIVDAFNAAKANAFAGAGKEAAELYSQTPGSVPFEPFEPYKEAYPRGKTFVGGDGKRYKVVGGSLYDPLVVEDK